MALEAFLSKLPSDSLVPEEIELFSLLESIGRKVQRFLPIMISVQDWAEFLPEFVGLVAWIQARIGEDIELMKLESGQHIFGLPGTLTITEETDKRYAKKRHHGKAQNSKEITVDAGKKLYP